MTVEREPQRNQHRHKRNEESPPSPVFLLLVSLSWTAFAYLLYKKWWSFGTNGRFEEWTIFLAVSAFVAAVLTGGLVLGQLNVMRRQLSDAHEAERPWIGFRDLEVARIVPADSTSGVRFVVVNSGRTPGHIITFNRGYIYTNNWTGPVTVTYPPEDGKHGRRTLFPGFPMKVPMRLRNMPPLCSGLRLYIVGEITYEDPRNGMRHYTRFCLRSAEIQTFDEPITELEYTAEHNDAT